MSRVRVQFTVLCEDEQAKEFVRVALGERGAGRREIRVLPLPSKPSGGAGDQHVRTRYVGQVRALRDEGRGSLIVHIDADPKNTVAGAARAAREAAHRSR